MSVQELAHKLAMLYLDQNDVSDSPEDVAKAYEDAYRRILAYIHSHPGEHWTI